jgi:hypothetical protein
MRLVSHSFVTACVTAKMFLVLELSNAKLPECSWKRVIVVHEETRLEVDTLIGFYYFCCAVCLPLHLSALRVRAGVQLNSLRLVY